MPILRQKATSRNEEWAPEGKLFFATYPNFKCTKMLHFENATLSLNNKHFMLMLTAIPKILPADIC